MFVLLLSFKSSLYILDTHPLTDRCFVNILSIHSPNKIFCILLLNFMYFPLRLPLWLIDYLWVCYLISRVWRFYCCPSISYFQLDSSMVKKYFLYEFINFCCCWCLLRLRIWSILQYSECSMGSWKEYVFCCWLVVFYKCELKPVFNSLRCSLFFLSSSSISCWGGNLVTLILGLSIYSFISISCSSCVLKPCCLVHTLRIGVASWWVGPFVVIQYLSCL